MGSVRIFFEPNRTEPKYFQTESGPNRFNFLKISNRTESNRNIFKPNRTEPKYFQTEPNRTEPIEIFKKFKPNRIEASQNFQ